MSSFSVHTPESGASVLQFEGETMTAREIRIGRYMFVEGAIWPLHGFRPTETAIAQREAKRRLPLPKVTRLRDVTIRLANGTRFRACSANGQLFDAVGRVPVEKINVEEFGPDALRQVADLLANPTEEVEAE